MFKKFAVLGFLLAAQVGFANHDVLPLHETPGTDGTYGPGNSVGAKNGDANCAGDLNSFFARVKVEGNPPGRGEFASEAKAYNSTTAKSRFSQAVWTFLGIPCEELVEP